MNLALPFTIRPMEPRDVPAVAAIERLSFPHPWSTASFWYELAHTNHASYFVLLRPEERKSTSRRRRWLTGLLGLHQETSVIGYVGFRLIGGTEAHITTLAVHPDWRGQGLGELLFLTALEAALEHTAVTRISLEARVSNHIAHNLYRKYGFRFQKIIRGYYRDGEDAWLMAVELQRREYRARLAARLAALLAKLRDRPEAHVARRSGGPTPAH